MVNSTEFGYEDDTVIFVGGNEAIQFQFFFKKTNQRVAKYTVSESHAIGVTFFEAFRNRALTKWKGSCFVAQKGNGSKCDNES